MDEEDKQSQEDPEDYIQSFEDTATGISRIAADGRGIDHLEPTIGGKSHETKTIMQFFQIEEPKGEIWNDEY